jgi:hypothetical protein
VTVSKQSATEEYFERKLKARRNRRNARLIATTGCCGCPILLLGLGLDVATAAFGLLLF